MLTATELLQELLRRARPLTEQETLPLERGLGGVLAHGVSSLVTVPPLDNSAMDGYAVRAADCTVLGVSLPVSQRIAAGQVGQPLRPGTAARIFTGAPIPAGADAVVMQEDACSTGEAVSIQRIPALGQHIRRAGEDLRAQDEVLAPGTRLSAADIGLAAAAGATELNLVRRLKVALFSTGDELAEPGQPLAPGQIYNSNRAALKALLAGLPVDAVDLGVVADTREATLDTLRQAAATADVILSTGGVSVGEEDHVKAAVESLGRLDLWKVAMKPGKPLAYGRIDAADFLGLPGNPVSSFATFCLFARPFLLKRMGASQVLYRAYPVRAAHDWPQNGGRREFLRGRLVTGADGRGEVRFYPNQGSGVLSSVSWADGFVDLGPETAVRRGDWLRFIPFSEVLG